MKPKTNKKASNLAGFKALGNFLTQTNQSRNPCQEQSNKKRTRDSKTLIFPIFANYEKQKDCWDEQNPNASAAERDAAILQIFQACGM